MQGVETPSMLGVSIFTSWHCKTVIIEEIPVPEVL